MTKRQGEVVRRGWCGRPPNRRVERSLFGAYRENDALIEEHANAERIQTEGGYGRRQVWELIQNGADELIDDRGQVEVVLTADRLYCANQGKPVTPEGAGAILSAYRSAKKGPEIGRFGLGFKSVLGVSAHPEFFSRSGSFGFDPARAAELIAEVAPNAGDVPTLRLAFPADPEAAAKKDPILRALMAWAATVVRLPLDRETGEWLRDDIAQISRRFPRFLPPRFSPDAGRPHLFHQARDRAPRIHGRVRAPTG